MIRRRNLSVGFICKEGEEKFQGSKEGVPEGE
jgi:hypothetical protein